MGGNEKWPRQDEDGDDDDGMGREIKKGRGRTASVPIMDGLGSRHAALRGKRDREIELIKDKPRLFN